MPRAPKIPCDPVFISENVHTDRKNGYNLTIIKSIVIFGANYIFFGRTIIIIINIMTVVTIEMKLLIVLNYFTKKLQIPTLFFARERHIAKCQILILM